jgi:hypothetical protein
VSRRARLDAHVFNGASGVCFFVILQIFFQVFSDNKYMHKAVQLGDIIWQRGLLRKGYGLYSKGWWRIEIQTFLHDNDFFPA